MAKASDTQIAQRAYEIWEKQGKPHGRHHDHWHQAVAELSTVGEAGPAPKAIAPKKPAVAKAAKAAAPAAKASAPVAAAAPKLREAVTAPARTKSAPAKKK